MKNSVLKVHPSDNIVVALADLKKGDTIPLEQGACHLAEDIPLKHKFAERDFSVGEAVVMYGVIIGRAVRPIPAGSRISRDNVVHDAEKYQLTPGTAAWSAPDTSHFSHRAFQGYARSGGKVGTRNYWLVVPLVFCENRNIKVLQAALLEPLGYLSERQFSVNTQQLIDAYRQGVHSPEELMQADILLDANQARQQRVFPNVDGIKFLTHDGGCGGTRQDSEALCRLIAGYILNPNVAGATVLSLGCQHAQMQLLENAILQFEPGFDKPLFMLEQQKSKSERDYIADAVKKTFSGLITANQASREPFPLSKLIVGLECGGSDGFSGITANPALGYASDLVASLGGTTLLSEFPELHGAEQELINRCAETATAEKFVQLMEAYAAQATATGSGFDMNPSPGNIRDGLITDAMKSAGAARKGGTSPVTDVLDYTELAQKAGLNLLCTPGNDVESTTALASSGANLIVFTTGLGTPTGNPIAPTIKMSSNSILARKMPDLIDIDAGTIVDGIDSIASKGAALLELMTAVASGQLTCAERLGQEDFIPWKRGVSL